MILKEFSIDKLKIIINCCLSSHPMEKESTEFSFCISAFSQLHLQVKYQVY